MPIEIPLTQGYVALVDDEDAYLADSSWHAHKSRGLVYARRSRRTPGTRKVTKEYMHRLILGEPSAQIDHRNGNTLDNRRCNLRVATGSQNQGNSKLRKDNATGLKGVLLIKYPTKQGIRVAWHAKCKTKSLGLFDTPEAAAVAYDCEAIAVFGEHARLNEDPWRYITGAYLAQAYEHELRKQRVKRLGAELKAAQAERKQLREQRRAV